MCESVYDGDTDALEVYFAFFFEGLFSMTPKVIILFILFLTFKYQAQAKEVLYLGRSPKGMMMGNAYTSYATDEYSLFYNPALIGRNDGVHFTPINPSIGVTNILDDMEKFSNFPTDAVGITDRILGVPIYLQTGIFPGLKMGPFAFSLFANQQTSMVLRNRVHPTLSIDYRLDRGFMFGGAFSIGTGAKASVWDGRSPKKDESLLMGIVGRMDLRSKISIARGYQVILTYLELT